MARKITATDFHDDSPQRSQERARIIAGVSEESLVENGAEKFASWRFEMDPEATLEALKCFVKPEFYGKAFGDEEVFKAIPDQRVAEVSFFKFEDGSGMAIAKISQADRAMATMLTKLSADELELMPKPPVPKKKKAETKDGKLVVNGTELTVRIEEPKEEEPVVARRHLPMQALGGQMPGVNMANPLAVKAFFKEIWGATQQSIAIQQGDPIWFLASASIKAASPNAHPDDAEWPEGIKVFNADTGEAFDSPKKAMMAFEAVAAGRKEPVLTEEDVVSNFRKVRGPK